MFDLLIFDCDGTLVDTEYMNNLASIQLLHEEGLTQYDMDYAFAHFVGVRQKEILGKITGETGHIFPADIGARYVQRNQELAPQYFKTIPGAPELVEIVSQKMKTCVASNGQWDNIVDSLKMAGLKKYFEDTHIYNAPMVKNGKPAPDLFLYAAEKMNTQIDKCLVIEDSVPGVTGAKAAGMTVFGFVGTHTDQVRYTEKLKAAGADEIFTSLIHIQNRLFGEKPL